MKANFTQNDLDKILDPTELEALKKANLPESDEASVSSEQKNAIPEIETSKDELAVEDNLVEESESIQPEEQVENNNYDSDYDPYATEEDAYESYDEESSNKKPIIIAAASVLVLVASYFIYGALSSPTVPVETKPSAEEVKMAKAKTDSIKAANLKPVFSANELSSISLKRSINKTISALFNTVEKNVAIEHVQISNNKLIVEYVSTDRAKIAKSLRKFENTNTVNGINTTDSKQVGATRLIKVTIRGTIASGSSLTSEMVNNIDNVESAIRSAAQKQSVKVSELSKISSNSYFFSSKISMNSLLSFLNEFNSTVSNSSYNKLSIVNHDKSSLSNKQFTLTQRITAHFSK